MRSIFVACLVIMVLSSGTVAAAKPHQENGNLDPVKRLHFLEPDTPKDIIELPNHKPKEPTNVKSPLEIINHGLPLSYRMLLDKPDWQRQIYKAYWHSTFWRWSYVPLRLYYAQHRLFTSLPAAASVFYDFGHDTGLWEELMNISTEENGQTQKERLARILVVVMQAKVDKIITQGNQVIIVVRPQRTGVQAFTVNKLNMHLDNPNESILFQLVTPDGYEIDYSIFG